MTRRKSFNANCAKWLRILVRRIAATAAILNWCAFSAGFAQAIQGPPTLDEVIDGLRKMEQRFFGARSLLLRYERTESNPSQLLLAEWTFAFRDDKWFLKRRFTQPYKSAELVVPGEAETNLVKESMVLEWKPGNKSAILDRFELGRNSYIGLHYTLNLSLDAPKFIARSMGVEHRMAEIRKRYGEYTDFPFLPEFLEKNRSNYRVLPSWQSVDGVPCCVVEWPGMDTIWIDPQRGFAIPRRRYSWGPGQPLRYEFYNRDYREVKPGLWLPFVQVEHRYFNPARGKREDAGKIRHRAEYKLRELQFDTLPQSFFDLRLPPGTIVFDVVREFRYSVSDESSDPFALPIAQSLDELRPPSRLWAVLISLLAGSLLLCVAVWIWRKCTR